MTTLHIISSCTERKRQAPLKHLRLRSIREREIDSRAAEWLQRLRSSKGDLPASEMYLGDHWAVSRGLPDLAARAGFKAHLWVASAGYGLVPADFHVAPYSATFASDQLDSVSHEKMAGSRRLASRRWWELLGALHRKSESPRSVTALAKESPSARIMVLGSPDYVAALSEDLVDARAALNQPERLLVITSRQGVTPDLEPNVVEVMARLRTHLGGAVGSLHARVARWLLERRDAAYLEAAYASGRVARLAARSPELPTFDRKKMTDIDVRQFIREGLRKDAGASCSTLLRRLRTSERACEQKRFRGLYHSIARGSHG